MRTDSEKIGHRVDVLERLLDQPGGWYPPHCNCTIKSRMVIHHMSDCPYRQLKEMCVEVRQLLSEGGSHE